MGTYYEALGLTNFESSESVAAAFSKLEPMLNPENHHGDAVFQAKFREIYEAYQVLSVPEQKDIYDRKLREILGSPTSSNLSTQSAVTHIQKEMELKFVESYNNIRFNKKAKREKKLIRTIAISLTILFITSIILFLILSVYEKLPQ